MEQHALELIDIMLGVIVFLLGGIGWLLKWLFTRLFQKIDEIETIFSGGMAERRKHEGILYDRVNSLDSRVVSIETKCELFHGREK